MIFCKTIQITKSQLLIKKQKSLSVKVPRGLEREVVEGQLQQPCALAESQLLGGSTVDVVD